MDIVKIVSSVAANVFSIKLFKNYAKYCILRATLFGQLKIGQLFFGHLKIGHICFGQLFYANWLDPRGPQNLTGHLVFPYFDAGGSVEAEKQIAHAELELIFY